MPDAHVLLRSFRDEILTLDRRRAELRGQLDALDQEHERLETTISVLEDRVGAAPQSRPDEPEEIPLADRIVDALGTSGLRRVEMMRLFTRQGFTASAIDSANNRLLKRGAVRREGRRIVRVVPPEEPGAPGAPGAGGVGDPESGAGPTSDPETVDGGLDDSLAAGAVSTNVVSGGPVAGEDDRPLTERVLEAIRTGLETRGELMTYFGSRGVKTSSVSGALSGLVKRGLVKTLGGGKLALAVAPGGE